MDLLGDTSISQCAAALVTSKENRPFISSFFGAAFSFFKGSLKPQHSILPLVKPHISAINSFRNALNYGEFTEKTRYVSFSLEDRANGDEYLTYGKVTVFTSLVPKKNAEDIAINIKLLNGKDILAIGSDLNNIAVSKASRQAFKQKSNGNIPHTPKIKIGEPVLAPLQGILTNGKILEFIGDQARVYFKDPLNHRDIRELISIELLKSPLQLGDSILIQNKYSYELPYTAIILNIRDDDTLLVTIKDGESEFKREVQPEEIVEVLKQSRYF